MCQTVGSNSFFALVQLELGSHWHISEVLDLAEQFSINLLNQDTPKKLWVSLIAGSGNFLSASSFFFEGFIPSGVAT